MAFKECGIKDLPENFVKLISDEWMLISAGDRSGFNMMTASWGFLGEIWGRDCAIVAIRPQRHTLKFVEENDLFTLSFYGNDKKIHGVCGVKSGRDTDKAKEAGLTPIFSDKTVYFEEARLVMVCRKLYTGRLNPDRFLDKSCLENYEAGDFHQMFIAEVLKTYVKQG